MRYPHLLVITVLVVCFMPSSIYAQFVLIDDFESYDLGEIDGQSDGSGIWNAGPTHEVTAEPNAVNQVLDALNSDTTNAFNDDPNILIDDGATGTLFFRIQRDVGVGGHVVYGLSDVAVPAAWGDFEASMGDRSITRMIETGTLEVRSGGSYIPVDFEIEPNEWINLWMVIDNDFDTFEVYAQSDTRFPEQTLLDDDSGETSFDFRNGTSDPLSIFLLRTGTPHEGSFFIDDIYLDPSGENLANPIPDPEPFIPGDFNSDGLVDVADFNILAANFRTGSTFAEGDFDFDRTVDLSDFVGFRQAFHGPQGLTEAVPEPSSILQLLMSLPLLFPRRRVSFLHG